MIIIFLLIAICVLSFVIFIIAITYPNKSNICNGIDYDNPQPKDKHIDHEGILKELIELHDTGFPLPEHYVKNHINYVDDDLKYEICTKNADCIRYLCCISNELAIKLVKDEHINILRMIKPPLAAMKVAASSSNSNINVLDYLKNNDHLSDKECLELIIINKEYFKFLKHHHLTPELIKKVKEIHKIEDILE